MVVVQSVKFINIICEITNIFLTDMGTSKNYFFFDASFDTNIYYGFLKT